jgi:ParB-like chromosome segregation protein Spo0J
MSDAEYEGLRNSIARFGQLEPIVVYQGMIFDGRHRWRALQELKLEPKTVTYAGDTPRR